MAMTRASPPAPSDTRAGPSACPLRQHPRGLGRQAGREHARKSQRLPTLPGSRRYDMVRGIEAGNYVASSAQPAGIEVRRNLARQVRRGKVGRR